MSSSPANAPSNEFVTLIATKCRPSLKPMACSVFACLILARGVISRHLGMLARDVSLLSWKSGAAWISALILTRCLFLLSMRHLHWACWFTSDTVSHTNDVLALFKAYSASRIHSGYLRVLPKLFSFASAFTARHCLLGCWLSGLRGNIAFFGLICRHFNLHRLSDEKLCLIFYDPLTTMWCHTESLALVVSP